MYQIIVLVLICTFVLLDLLSSSEHKRRYFEECFCLRGNGAQNNPQKYLLLCSKEESKSYRFGTTW